MYYGNKKDNCPPPAISLEQEDLQKIVVDQTAAKDFNLNPFGHIGNDVSNIMRAQTKEEFDALLRSAKDVIATDNNAANKGKTLNQLIMELVPRTVQSPSEIGQYVDFLKRNGVYNDLVKASDVVDKKDAKEDASVESPSVETPAPAASV